jgi:hypothetical protein
MLNMIKTKLQLIAHTRYLKRVGWTQAEYDRAYDPGTNFRASRVKDMYPGYPYVFELEYALGFWTQFGDWAQGLSIMKDWAQEHCKDKWRDDFHRVIKDYWGDWECNELGGGDVLFFAFKSEQDCMWFTLRWT